MISTICIICTNLAEIIIFYHTKIPFRPYLTYIYISFIPSTPLKNSPPWVEVNFRPIPPQFGSCTSLVAILIQGCWKWLPSREWIHIPPNGKFGKSSSKVPFWEDMLVPWRVDVEMMFWIYKITILGRNLFVGISGPKHWNVRCRKARIGAV